MPRTWCTFSFEGRVFTPNRAACLGVVRRFVHTPARAPPKGRLERHGWRSRSRAPTSVRRGPSADAGHHPFRRLAGRAGAVPGGGNDDPTAHRALGGRAHPAPLLGPFGA